MPNKRILHYGLQRSGTNYLYRLMLQSFYVDIINREKERSHPGHKHFRIYDNKSLIGRPNYLNDIIISDLADLEKHLRDQDPLAGIVVISKDPYSWLLSYQNWARRQNWPAPEKHYLLEYNAFYNKWLELASMEQKVIHVRYKDLLLDTESTLKNIKEGLDLDTRSKSKKSHYLRKVPRSGRFTEKNKKYYKENLYLKEYTSAELREINALIDHELIRKMGYKSYL